MASSGSSGQLSASNSRVELSLSLSQPCLIGTTLRPTVHYKADAHYASTSLRLVGETRATIMGKERWQAGVVMNASLGGPAMGAAGMPITSVERLTFLDFEIPLVSSSSAPHDAKRPEKSEWDAHMPQAGSRAVYEFALPAPPDEQLLPALAPREFDMTTVSVVWTLKFVGVRKGLLRKNDSLSIDLPVVCASRQPSLPRTVSAVQSFKFDTGKNEGMTLQAHVDATPLSHRAPLLFSLSLEPSSSSAAHLLTTSSPPVKVNASLSRHTRTTPIANPNSGRSFEWAGVRILAVDLERVKDDDWRWQGMIQIPEGECTVESKGVAVTHKLNCHIISPVLAQAALHVSLPVFLPSSPIESSQDQLDDVVNPHDLPAYTAA
ncbi:hypothetical protein JCM3766R1_000142 [Sporobolomyces carnicolor]